MGLTLLLPGTAASANPQAGSSNQALHLAKVPPRCADFRTDVRGVGFDHTEYVALMVCDSLDLGDAIRPLRTLDMTWDVDCLHSHGWLLDADGNAPVPPQSPDRPLHAADLAACGTLRPTDVQCDQFGEGLQPGGQPYSAATAAVLAALGCERPGGSGAI